MEIDENITKVIFGKGITTLGKEAGSILADAWHHNLHENFGIFLFHGSDGYINIKKADLPKFIEWLIAIQNHDRQSGPLPKLDLHNTQS